MKEQRYRKERQHYKLVDTDYIQKKSTRLWQHMWGQERKRKEQDSIINNWPMYHFMGEHQFSSDQELV